MRSGGVTGIHPTKQGELYLSANTPHFWMALCELASLDELAADPRFATVRLRAQHAHLIIPKLRATLLTRTAVEWEAIFGERVPNAAVRPMEDMFDHPQVLAQQMVTTVDHQTIGPYRCLSRPLKFSATPGPQPFAAPVFGQDSASILAELGYSSGEIAGLTAEGAVLTSER